MLDVIAFCYTSERVFLYIIKVMYLLQMYLCVFVNRFAAFHDLVDHHFRGPSTEWKEHWAVAVSFSGFFKYFTHASAQILFCQSAGQGFCLVS